MPEINGKLLGGATLAYLGDAVYEVAVRRHLLEQGQTVPHKLHQLATHYVSAAAQAELIDAMTTAEILSADEWSYFKRGRNAQSYTKAKNADWATYSHSTGFEALIGYLAATDQPERLREILDWCLQTVDQKLEQPRAKE